MSTDPLKDSIAEVKVLMHAALDGKERDFLGDLMEAIGRGQKTHDDTDIGDQLDAKALEFESNHPKLARAIREVMDALNKMGV